MVSFSHLNSRTHLLLSSCLQMKTLASLNRMAAATAVPDADLDISPLTPPREQI
jgi:hypothetical protein